MKARLEVVGGRGEPTPAPFVRARLGNGVRVLARANPWQPIVAVDCWLGVGALDESDEHAGISHFLEHMFFKGTARFPVGAMDRRVKEMGGYNNAATSMEYTHYYIVAPGDRLGDAVDLLAEHLQRPSLAAPELDRERTVVKEEIRRRRDAPTGRLYTALGEAVFGATAYAREVLGTPESLDRIDREAMRDYWERHYRADRLAVAIAGDVEPEAAVAEVERRLGELTPAGTAAERPPPPPPPDPAVVEERMDVGQAYLAWGFTTAGRSDLAELAAVEVAVTILGDGMTSRLYRRLVDELRLVTSVSAWSYGLEAAGMLGLHAVFEPARRAAVEAELVAVLDGAREAIDEVEVERAKAMLLAEFAYDNETNAGMTGTLGEFEVVFGAAERFGDVLAALAAVTPDDVVEVLRRRADPRRAVRAWVGPRDG